MSFPALKLSSINSLHEVSISEGVFTLPNMPPYARLFRGTIRIFILPEVNCLFELAPQFTLPDPTHIGGLLGFILM